MSIFGKMFVINFQATYFDCYHQAKVEHSLCAQKVCTLWDLNHRNGWFIWLQFPSISRRVGQN